MTGRIINTTGGAREIPKGTVENTSQNVNTSRIVEEDLEYLDEEPEIIAVLPAERWYAKCAGVLKPLVAWVAMDSGEMYGVVVGDDGRIDLQVSVENDSFEGYQKEDS